MKSWKQKLLTWNSYGGNKVQPPPNKNHKNSLKGRDYASGELDFLYANNEIGGT